MPIHDVGYRNWTGKLMSMFSRWWVIAEVGIKINLKNNWVRRTLLLAWLPVIGAGFGIFFAEKLLEFVVNNPRSVGLVNAADDAISGLRDQFRSLDQNQDGVIDESEVDPDLYPLFDRLDRNKNGVLEQVELMILKPEGASIFEDFLEMKEIFPNFEPVEKAIISGDQSEARKRLWSWILLNFFRSFQGVSVVLLLGLVVPPLVAQDVRSRAFQLYYARPIGRIDYIMGKLAIPAFFIFLITTAPALGLYFFGLTMSPDLSVIYDTWHIPVQIIVASIFLILPTCTLALMFSSLTYESRFAGFAWFAVWGLGVVAWSTIYTANATKDGMFDQKFESNWTLVSLYNTLYKTQSWIFGLEDRFAYVAPSLILLATITSISFIILYRRVAAPLRT